MLNLNAVRKRFLAINRERLLRTRESLRSGQQDFLDILPLLFHANHPIFPGYISNSTPAGISDYSPTKRSLSAGKKLVRSFDYKKKALYQYDIQSMFLMGSSGTIAYSDKSDYDIWLCHQPGLSNAQLDELQLKASAIEKWAATFDLEVHFFLMEAESFRKGATVELSVESSGSAQHHLLLEEFYRTGLLIAGRYPVWWLVEPGKEKDYEREVHDLKFKRFIKEGESIDFGGLPRAPAEEFFGAALWQLYKGVDSPYKAVLKLMLMEAYASEYPDVDLLCIRFKQLIHEGTIDLASLDPYIMLYQKLEEYLRSRNDLERLELVRRCFYFKVNETLGSPDTARNMTWQRETMREIVDKWGWNERYLALMDSRSSWKINRVLDERKSLVDTLTQSYQFLSRFARNHTQLSSINQRDLNILGRKLYAAFERKAGKIDIVNRGVSDDLWESHLSFHEVGNADQVSWTLYRGVVTAEDTAIVKPLKRSRSIVELLAWCFFNNLMDDRTIVALYNRESLVAVKDAHDILRCFHQLFPNAKLGKTSMDDLMQPPRLVKTAVFINIGKEPLSNRLRDGKQLTSSKIDALSYGGICENLVLSFDQVQQTSWQEVLTFRYEGVEGLIECLSAYIQWYKPTQSIIPPPMKVFCFTSGRAMSIANRVEELFNDIISCYCNSAHPEQTRYLLRIEHKYFMLMLGNNAFEHYEADTYQDLLRYLSLEQKTFSPVVVDRYALQDTVLPLIFHQNREGVIQLFYQLDKTRVDVYVIDEKGSLFCQTIHDMDDRVILGHYKRFFRSMMNRQHFQISSGFDNGSTFDDIEMEFFQIRKVRGGDLRLVRKEVEGDQSKGYFNLQVIGEDPGYGKPIFTMYCDDDELTSLEFGDQLFHEVAKHVLEQRKSGLLYPIYITDIDLPGTLLGYDDDGFPQTISFLNYKKVIEEKLNRALSALGDQSGSEYRANSKRR
ncbi:MAG: class I adenylate cyclase [Gammaproteobacteria bacterium]